MSTGLECQFIEIEPDKWYMVLETRGGDQWDWMETATVDGPFDTFDKALAHLDANYANPGGFSESPYDEAYAKSERIQRLAKRANAPLPSRRW